MDISEWQHFDILVRSKSNRQQLKDILRELILRAAGILEVGTERNLAEALRERLPDIVPQDCYCNLRKCDNEGSHLSARFGVNWFAPNGELEGRELDEFQKLLQKANKQLAEAEARGITDAFVIVIEIWFSGAEADVLQATLRHFEPTNYPHIKFLYRIGGGSPPSVHELFLGNTNAATGQARSPRAK